MVLVLPDPHWFDIWSRSVIHLTATKTLEDHRNMSDVLSKLRDVQQKKLDVIFKDVCWLLLARIYLACPITSVKCERSFSVLLCQLTHNRPVSVESRAHACGTFLLWHMPISVTPLLSRLAERIVVIDWLRPALSIVSWPVRLQTYW